jgi:hypothetical protein
MSYAKKNEDAEMAGLRLERTTVFQDGTAALPMTITLPPTAMS